MSKLLCLKCGEIYDKGLKPLNEEEYNFCPKSSCIGEIVEVDEMILPVIRILNLKGYRTKFCCSGHPEKKKPNGYILFDFGYRPKTIPAGFEEEGRYAIRSNFEESGYYINTKKILEDMYALMEWAISLPYNKNTTEE